jgi:two-component system OmpR family sensor kinase/two-component system sensor histidine kinase BaeS
MMIYNRLWFKLTAAFLVVAIIGVALVAYLANRATSAGFNRFLNQDNAAEMALLREDLVAYYLIQGDWRGVDEVLRTYRPGRGQGTGGGNVLALLDQEGEVTAWAGGGRGQEPVVDPKDGVPILVDGVMVGTLVVELPPGATGGGAAQQFLESVNQAIVWAGLVAVLLALFLGVLFARGLTRPLGQLTRATRAMADGNLVQQVDVNSNDELGELAGSFNQMATALADNEQGRQQLFADIAHELRTPLSVIRGQLEGMLDGVFEMTPENVSIVHEESILLSRLVEELRTLSLAEAGQLPLQLEQVDLGDIVRQAAAAFEPLAELDGVRLQVAIDPELPPVTADPARIQQVLGNLLSNALRHANQGGKQSPEVSLKVTLAQPDVQVRVSDNGPGLPAENQLHVFDRFWRADASRNRDKGGSGLGLAICKGIIQVHNGRIWVESGPGQGTTFAFELPGNFHQREDLAV